MSINNSNIIIYDIETIKGYFLASFYFPETNKWYDFSVNQYRNDLPNLYKFLELHEIYNFIGFNNINFDGQVIEYLWRNQNEMLNLSSKELTKHIWQKAQDIIEAMNHGGFAQYREEALTFRQIDVFKIQHFDNKNRRVGLKRLEFEMDMEDVREMSVEHTKEDFSIMEAKELISYCHNDIIGTYKNYKYLIGETDNEIYKGTNQIELREKLTETFGINCINYANSKYGDEIMKKVYSQELNMKIDDIPKTGTFAKSLYFKSCIPKFIEFKTPILKEFLKELKTIVIDVSEKYEKTLNIGSRRHTFALGGLHSETENESFEADENTELIDVDVSGYYVWTIISQKIFPKHLNKNAFLKVVEWLYNERIKLKPLVKTNPEYKALVAGYKEAAVSLYGKMGDMTNWMYYPQGRLHICLSGQLSILMLIEELELEGFKCFMSNTDGASFVVSKNKKELFYKICNKWCEKTTYELEYANFKKVFFQNVNNYIAIKDNGEVKKKGVFLTSTELHKNKSFRAIALGLEQYFVNGIKPEDFIPKHNNIFDFVGRSVAGRNKFYHKDITQNIKLPQLIRYIPCKHEYGSKIMKMKDPKNPSNAANTNIEPADLNKFVCNRINNKTDYLDYVNFDWFVDECYKIIKPIELGRKLKIVKTPKEQLSLFNF